MNRELIFRMAAEHSDARVHNRARAIVGWNFDKVGLLGFVQAIRKMQADEEMDNARWADHIEMEQAIRRARFAEFGEPVYGSGEQSALQ